MHKLLGKYPLMLLVLLAALAFGLPAFAAPSKAKTSPWSRIAEPSTKLAKRRKRRRRRRRRAKPRSKAPARQPAAKPATAGKPTGPAGGPAKADGSPLRRGARVEFDGRLVQGQTATSGAIYLFARKRSKLRSMVKERSTYRREIVRDLYRTRDAEKRSRRKGGK